MKIYLAGRYDTRLELANIAATLANYNHTITSRWLSGEHDDIEPRLAAKLDLEDIDSAEGIILLNRDEDRTITNGRHFEFGYAYAKGKRMVILGTRSGVFHFLPQIEQYSNIADLVANL